MTKTNKMNTIVTMNWRIKDLIREKLSFQKWHKTVFGVDASRKVLSKIKAEAKELVEMKEAMLLAATDEAAA
jgi:hypothetical protein|tara:strand:- start:391 stop:606 length:216 start_codon:yes stop_codon:yes gene_type:complete